MTEDGYERYRIAVAEEMPDSPYKTALVAAIQARMSALRNSPHAREVEQAFETWLSVPLAATHAMSHPFKHRQ